MALVIQPSMNLSAPTSTTGSPNESKEKDLVAGSLGKHRDLASSVSGSTADLDSVSKKRPLSEDASSDSHKRQRTTCKRSVRFLPDPTEASRVAVETRTFTIDYSKEDVWWTNGESREHMERQASLLQFYAANCADLVDSVLLVWVHCAEQAMNDGDYCMTMEQRAQVTMKVAQSPVRGFEKELASELITEQRYKTLGGLMELQVMCKTNNVTQEEQIEAMAAASEAFSQTATFFARSIAKADAEVAKDYCS